MKKISLFFLLLFSQHFFSQDTITQLEEVIVVGSYKKDIKKIVKNIKKRIKDDVEVSQKLYEVKEISIFDNEDTLINNSLQINLMSKSFDNNFTKKNIETDKNLLFKDLEFFKKYSDYRDSPEFWLCEVLYKKNLNVLGFDFFNDFATYDFDIKYDENFITINFTSTDMYSGFFVCDRYNYNLKTISYKNSSPYPFFVSYNDNGIKKGLKKWNYISEITTIEFGTNELNKIYIKSLNATEVIFDYVFEKYDKKGKVIYSEGPFIFHSSLEMVEVIKI